MVALGYANAKVRINEKLPFTIASATDDGRRQVIIQIGHHRVLIERAAEKINSGRADNVTRMDVGNLASLIGELLVGLASDFPSSFARFTSGLLVAFCTAF
jgi:hypothetical protein